MWEVKTLTVGKIIYGKVERKEQSTELWGILIFQAGRGKEL
jgi:hypothetical protein